MEYGKGALQGLAGSHQASQPSCLAVRSEAQGADVLQNFWVFNLVRWTKSTLCVSMHDVMALT